MSDHHHRRTLYVSAGVLPWLRLIGFHFDYAHDGYVLWGIGRRRGPIIRDQTRHGL